MLKFLKGVFLAIYGSAALMFFHHFITMIGETE